MTDPPALATHPALAAAWTLGPPPPPGSDAASRLAVERARLDAEARRPARRIRRRAAAVGLAVALGAATLAGQLVDPAPAGVLGLLAGIVGAFLAHWPERRAPTLPIQPWPLPPVVAAGDPLAVDLTTDEPLAWQLLAAAQVGRQAAAWVVDEGRAAGPFVVQVPAAGPAQHVSDDASLVWTLRLARPGGDRAAIHLPIVVAPWRSRA